MLQYFYDNDLIYLCKKKPKNWQEAIAFSCQPLLDKGLITQQYVEEIIACVKEYGPYIVLVPEVAMPHASSNNEGVLGTAISFTKMPQKVFFQDKDEEMQARLFFTIAAKNNEEHMENIAKLSEMLMTEGVIEALLAVESMADYRQVMATFHL